MRLHVIFLYLLIDIIKSVTLLYREDVLYQYEMSYMKEYGSYGTSSNRVNFNEGNLENIREKKINFILNNEKALELGEKYDRLSHRSKNFHLNVKEVLLEMIYTELQKNIKRLRFLIYQKLYLFLLMIEHIFLH